MSGCAGVIVAAPLSGSGKTVVTLAILRAFRRSGMRVAGAKAGPDYIDPAFHAAATGLPSLNLDPWAMRPQTISASVAAIARAAELAVCEGVMGLFDGAAGGKGSTADLAALTGWPVVLIVDASRQGASAAALVQGFAHHRNDIRVAAAIFNRVSSRAHREAIDAAMIATCPDVPVLGHVPRNAALALPERHLGLVQARETPALDAFLDGAADIVAANVDLPRLASLATPARTHATNESLRPLDPIGARIAVARDDAFAFCYQALLQGWRDAGAELSFFSVLGGEKPEAFCDAIYLPGGYPELHAGKIAASPALEALRSAAARGAPIYGECGGYMVLGKGLTDASGARHAMAGLLELETSFAERRLHLGYREVVCEQDSALAEKGARFRGHEFHYAKTVAEGNSPLFSACDAAGAALGTAGQKGGSVVGSFVHLVDKA